jgi:hypothetical protein
MNNWRRICDWGSLYKTNETLSLMTLDKSLKVEVLERMEDANTRKSCCKFHACANKSVKMTQETL